MAIYHCRLKPAKTTAVAHCDYIERERRYADIKGQRNEVIIRGHGNMPAWTQDEPRRFWEAAESFERVNANTYREIEIALPRELNHEQMTRLVQSFTQDQFGCRHAHEYVIHLNENNPHAHVMFSEKMNDGISRSEEQYFKRYNRAYPERGGCLKSDDWKARGRQPSQRLLKVRESWANLCNLALKQAYVETRVDHRTLKCQGITRAPQIHIGYYDPAQPRIHAARIQLNEDIKLVNAEQEAQIELTNARAEFARASNAIHLSSGDNSPDSILKSPPFTAQPKETTSEQLGRLTAIRNATGEKLKLKREEIRVLRARPFDNYKEQIRLKKIENEHHALVLEWKELDAAVRELNRQPKLGNDPTPSR